MGSYNSGEYAADGSCLVRNFGMDNKGLMDSLTIFSGAISGGAGAALAGGIPIAIGRQGAVTGLIVSGLNHAMHGGFAKKYNVADMLDEQGANGAGHEGIAFELKNGKYHYISKDGAEDYVIGTPKYTDEIVDNLFEANKLYTKASEGKNYDKIAFYKATARQIQKGIAFAQKSVRSYYCLIGNSCTTLVAGAMASTFNGTFRSFFEGSIPRLNFSTRTIMYSSYYSHTLNFNKLLKL